jgi:hypothetical protein
MQMPWCFKIKVHCYPLKTKIYSRGERLEVLVEVFFYSAFGCIMTHRCSHNYNASTHSIIGRTKERLNKKTYHTDFHCYTSFFSSSLSNKNWCSLSFHERSFVVLYNQLDSSTSRFHTFSNFGKILHFHFFSTVQPCIIGREGIGLIVYYLVICIFIALKFESGFKFSHF